MCMYTEGLGGKPNNRCLFVRPSFYHNDNDTQGVTEYELRDVNVPTYETGAYSFDPDVTCPGARSPGHLFRRNPFSSLIGFRDIFVLFSQELVHILLRDCFQSVTGNPKLSWRFKKASDYIDGTKLCPAVMTFVLETLQMPHDFMRIGDVCYCLVYVDPKTARQLLCFMHINARRKWTESKQNRKTPQQDTQRDSLHTTVCFF